MQFSNLTGLSRRLVGKIQTAESVRVSVKNDIVDVLSVGVDSAVGSYEASRGEASFYGKTNIKFIYSDGVTVSGQSYSADFTASISSDILNTDSKLTFDVVTTDTKVDSSANTATLTILLEVTVYAYIAESAPCLAESEDAFCRVEPTEYLQAAELFNIPLVIDEELNASRNITTVLLAESSIALGEYTLTEGVLHVCGDASVRLTYISDGKIVTEDLPFKFDRELDAEGIDPDSQLRISVTSKNTKVRLNISEDEVNTVFSAEINANVRVEALKIGLCDIVSDAYGTNCDYNLERKSLSTTLPCGSTSVRRRVSSTLPLDNGKTPLTAVNVSAVVTGCTSLEHRAEIVGVIQATVLYSTDSGTVGEPAEIPFAETVPVDYLMPQCTSHAHAVVLGFSVSANGALQTEAELCFFVESERDETCTVIVSAEEIPFDKSALPAIEVCMVHKGETLWQLCKGLHMSQEDLLATNPEISDPPESDARIVIFNRIYH